MTASFAIILVYKSAAIWLGNKAYSLAKLQWINLKQDIQLYFWPADYHCCTCNALALYSQNASVMCDIDAMK